MASPPPSPWSDRRGLFQKGREVHQPGKPVTAVGASIVDAVRRSSTSSNDGLEKTTSNTSVGGGNSTASQRRRSSNAGQGLFANLAQHKRGSQDYSERRASHSDQSVAGGFLGGWYQNTFKGAVPSQKPADSSPKKGVAE